MSPHAATPQFDTGSEVEVELPGQAPFSMGADGAAAGMPSDGANIAAGMTADTPAGTGLGGAAVDIAAGVGSPSVSTGYSVGGTPETAPSGEGTGISGNIPGGADIGGPSHSVPGSSPGGAAYAPGNIAAYNQALFGQFMPGFDQPEVSIDSSRAGDGILEVRHEDGSGTAFYDRTMYQQPRGDHRVFEDSRGGQWYAIHGTPAVEQRPVYQDGKPVYEGEKLQTMAVETVRYKTTPARYAEPARRPSRERKAPKKKN